MPFPPAHDPTCTMKHSRKYPHDQRCPTLGAMQRYYDRKYRRRLATERDRKELTRLAEA